MLGFAFFMGFVIGPAMHHIAEVQPEIITQAILMSVMAFAGFSGIAVFSKRRSYLFLGGIISSMMMCLMMYNMMNWAFGGSPLGIAYLFIGLLMACMWIIFDT